MYKLCCSVVHLLDDSALTLKSFDVGATKTSVHMPQGRTPKWCQVVVTEEEWKRLMHVIKENGSDVDYEMLQEVMDGRPSKKGTRAN